LAPCGRCYNRECAFELMDSSSSGLALEKDRRSYQHCNEALAATSFVVSFRLIVPSPTYIFFEDCWVAVSSSVNGRGLQRELEGEHE